MRGLKTISKGLLITKGLKLLSKGLSYGKGLLVALDLMPNPDTLSRWFTTRDNYTLLDKSGNGLDAEVLAPVSVFNGVDGRVSFVGEDTNYFKFEGYVSTNTTAGIQTVFNSNNGYGGIDIRIQNGKLEVLKAGVSFIITSNTSPFLSTNTPIKVTVICDKINNLSEIYFNDILDNSSVYAEECLFTTFTFGSEELSRYINGSIYGAIITLSNNTYSIPLPHLGIGFDQNNDPVTLTVSGGVTEGFDEVGSLHLQNYGYVKKLDGTIIPNGYDGKALYALESTDVFVAGSTTRLNTSPCKVRLYTLGDTEPAKLFFDKSNALIYKDSARALLSYDSANTGDFRETDLTQQWVYDNVNEAYQYQWWVKLKSNSIYSDLFLYPAHLVDDSICKAKKYVQLGETYATIEDATYLCDTDTLID